MTMNSRPCIGPECDRPGYTFNMCRSHEQQYRRTGKTWPVRRQRPQVTCTGPGCGRKAPASTGLCHAHKQQQDRGSELRPLGSPRAAPVKPRKPRAVSPDSPQARARAAGLPDTWFVPAAGPAKPARPRGEITHNTIGDVGTITPDQAHNAALVAVTHGHNPAERRTILDTLGLTEHLTSQKAA